MCILYVYVSHVSLRKLHMYLTICNDVEELQYVITLRFKHYVYV